MIEEELENGEIVNESDELVGIYKKLSNNLFYLKVYDRTYNVTENSLKQKIMELNLFTVPIR